jgi:hypothetical protein
MQPEQALGRLAGRVAIVTGGSICHDGAIGLRY